MISRQRRSQLKHPERHRARAMAQRALRDGKIRRRACEEFEVDVADWRESTGR